MKKWIAAAGVGIALVIGCVVAVSVEGAAAARDAERWPAPGKLVELADGTVLHVICTGPPSLTTVVFEAGLGESSMTWSDVQPAVAENTRACSYDRAGYGWSDASQSDRDAATGAPQLREALDRVGESGPYLLVAHSLGALVARQFAADYPTEVAGLVLLDPTDPESVQGAGYPLVPIAQARAQALLGRVGLLRPFMPQLVADQTGAALPVGVRDRAQLLYRAEAFDATANELERTTESARQVVEAGPLHGVPVTILSTADSAMSAVEAARISDASTIVLLNGGHYIHYEHPEKVITAIGDMLNSLLK